MKAIPAYPLSGPELQAYGRILDRLDAAGVELEDTDGVALARWAQVQALHEQAARALEDVVDPWGSAEMDVWLRTGEQLLVLEDLHGLTPTARVAFRDDPPEGDGARLFAGAR